jgi:DNA-binding PadR family transcriptional regulator
MRTVAQDPREHLPLKDLVFRIPLTLADGERHGWSLARALDDPTTQARLLPGHFYRTLDRMLDDGLIEERDRPVAPVPQRRTRGTSPTRFFRITPLGRRVAREEVRRLEALIAKSRTSRLLTGRR